MPRTALAPADLRLSLRDALDDLISAYEVAGRSTHTVLAFTTHVGRFSDFIASDGIEYVDQVTTAHVTRYLASERKRGLKPASLSISLRTLRRFFAYHVEQGSISTNPARAVVAPSVVAEPVQFLDDEQINALLHSIGRTSVEDVRDAALLRVLIDAGVRRGELAGLRVSDVDLDAGVISVRATTSKARRGRQVAISRDTARHLSRWMRLRARRWPESGDDLWIGQRGPLTPNGLLQALHARLDAAGLPKVSMHSFRHRMAATAIQNGLPMAYLLAVGGWTNPAMPTARYGQYGVEGRALSAMHALLGRPRS